MLIGICKVGSRTHLEAESAVHWRESVFEEFEAQGGRLAWPALGQGTDHRKCSGLCLIWRSPRAGLKAQRRGGKKVGGLISVLRNETDLTLQTQGFLYILPEVARGWQYRHPGPEARSRSGTTSLWLCLKGIHDESRLDRW